MTIIMILIGIWIAYIVFRPKRKSKKNLSAPKKGKIETELVPYAMHGINVRSRVNADTWKRIARQAYMLNLARFKLFKDECEVCRGNGRQQGFIHPLEAHEEWSFDHGARTQKLTRIRSLCPLCHKAVHMGLSDKQGYGQQARKHMMRVNGWTAAQVQAHIDQAKQTVKTMNGMGKYKLDLTYLNHRDYAATHQVKFTGNETSNCQPNTYE